jgi:hypothetical protein
MLVPTEMGYMVAALYKNNIQQLTKSYYSL